MQMKVEEQQEQQPKKTFNKTPISICQVNQVLAQDQQKQFNAVDQEFRKYALTFSVIKKRRETVQMINNQFANLQRKFLQYLYEQNLAHDKKGKKLFKNYQLIQSKAWSLNLNRVDEIKKVTNTDEIPDEFIKMVAEIIKSDNHE
ncbi:hypothetical protein pb186bvf_012083 [Paramecium bursaria]